MPSEQSEAELEHFRYDPTAGYNSEGAIVALDREIELYMTSLESAKQVYEELGKAIERAEEEGHINAE